ncbi:MAG: DUF6273 domain-containing protein [Candidatus Borkfalkiaceae bacterium]|nr:DUF6273 domain-containing protein [Christensenellaceae bacterium]
MAIFKCKMCGGSLNVEPNASVVECEYCGTKQTVPKLDDDKRANLYDRANHFRRSNDYDKAMAIYEQILNEEPSDAEAYWSLVLCRYGIEYVEDPLTHKRVPTVNRAQFTSVYSDEDYKSALKYADGSQRIVYEDEAKAIDDIQKGILEISQKESPFDVFICYKETDSNGRRTQDSVLANDLYHQLTQEGFKVFFARITLEDKLGSAYEPYIFAALNSAKVMVVLGTKPEYFNAVWVKNEWSRYLALIKKGAKKMLIPAYRDMDPYDLPEEFSHLQAQDMGKLGFMQDLIRGIKKIVAKSEPKQTAKETFVLSGGANVAPLLKRAFIFLEDGNWAEADEYCEKVLDQDPENAQAYLGKLMAEMRVSTQEKLADCKTPFDNSNNFHKAVKYGGENLAATLNGYVSGIKERNEQARLNSVYNGAMQKMGQACSEKDFNAAAQQFKSISNFKNSAALAEECFNKAEECRKNEIYDSAKKQMHKIAVYDTMSGKKAIELFKSIPGWKDADKQAEDCERIIKEMVEQHEANRIAFEAEEKRKNKITAIIAASLIVGVIFIVLLTTVIIPTINNNKIYDAGVYLYQNGRYDEAIETFESLNGYKDSESKIIDCKYDKAVSLYNTGNYDREIEAYDEAIEIFESLNGYKDSESKITDCKYGKAISLYYKGNYDEAIKAFKSLNGYKDSESKIVDCKYSKAVYLFNTGNYADAYNIFKGLNGEKESNLYTIRCYTYLKNKMNTAAVGDSVYFGSYEQDNDLSNGKEIVEWTVLEKKGNSLFIISKYALDCKKYDNSYTSVTWETCSLRTWLNNEFYNAVFSEQEKSKIKITFVTADKNPEYDTNPGNATNDKVFLLSIPEVNKYFSSDDERECKATVYAEENGVYTYSGWRCDWWLRSPGRKASYSLEDDKVAYVEFYGEVRNYGDWAYEDNNGVRPALWITL